MAILGWTSAETLSTSPEDIRTAVDSRYGFVREILESVFGKPSTPTATPPVSKRKMTARLFDVLFGGKK
jgi:hypothetical protein